MQQSAIGPEPIERSTVIQAADLAGMTRDLFVQMLSLPFADDAVNDVNPERGWLQASICVSGEWNAQVHVLAPQEVARDITAAMLCVDPSEISATDVRDALGEVVNVVGGNAKGIADRDCDLSLPCVGEYSPVAGDDEPVWLQEAALSLTFSCAGGHITVVLVEPK